MEAFSKFRVEVNTTLGGRLNFHTNDREKAQTFFDKSKGDEIYAYGVFGEVGEDGQIITEIESFDKRPKEDA